MATRDRKPYLTAMALTQALLDQCADNLEGQLELIVDVERPDGDIIRASDRNKYVGGTFYEALTQFPIISRTLGDWLSPVVEFSSLTISVSNVDGRFNDILPEGANYGGWLNRKVTVKLGLREVASTYEAIYEGQVTDVGGVQRDRSKITLITRDKFDRVNQRFPNQVLKSDEFPDIASEFIGVVVPIIYGDWTVKLATDNGADVPAFPVNSGKQDVIDGNENLQLVVSENANTDFLTSGVYVKRGDFYYPVDSGDVQNLNGDKNVFELRQSGTGGTTTIDGTPFKYESGDAFFVKVKGKDLGTYDDNLVWQARDILMSYGGVSSGEFDANWATYRDKSSPSQSAISSFKSRVWVQEQQEAMQYALSMLEQVRLEAFVDKNLNFKLNSLHFEDFDPTPGFTVKNWDLEAGTLSPKLDDRNIWNRAQADYAFTPSINANFRQTPIFKNQDAITQTGKAISKKVVFPNLYEEATVILQLKEMLKLASGYAEFIDMTLNARAMKQDLGNFVSINVDMGSTRFNNVPAMIREIGYDSRGLRIPVKLWSFQMCPFPGYEPGHAGIVGGYSATITQE